MIAFGISTLAILVCLAIALMHFRVSRPAGNIAFLVTLVLLTFDWRLATSGTLHRWHDLPPPMALPVLAGAVAALAGALLPIGRRVINTIPLAILIGFQGFRLPLELVMHQAAVQGVMPVQMSYSGLNFDIVTGVSALVVAALLAVGRAPRWLLVTWNLVGTGLLVTIMVIAVASTPTFAAFGPDYLNVWIADPPFVWLPGILVPAAIWGHTLVWRVLVSMKRLSDDPMIRWSDDPMIR